MADKSSKANFGGWIFRIGMLRGMVGQAKLAWHLFQDSRVPVVAKGIPLLAMLYVVSPIDLIADVIPVLGQMDDIAVIGLGLRAFIKAAPADVVEEYRQRLGDNS